MEISVNKNLLNFLLEAPPKDELTRLWALGYETKEDKDKTILIEHITNILNDLFHEPNENDIGYEKTYEIETEKNITAKPLPTIKINNDEIQTIIEFVNDNNPLLGLESEYNAELKSNHPMSVPAVVTTTSFDTTKEKQRPMSAPAVVTTTSIDKKKETQRSMSSPVTANAISQNQQNKLQPNFLIKTPFNAWGKEFIPVNRYQGRAAGIKKSRRKKRKRKRTKRKRTKGKRTKGKRTKGKRTKGKRTKGKHKGGSSQPNICSYNGPDDNILKPLDIGWGVNIRTKNSKLAANKGCRRNTGNLVLNLLCNDDDKLSVIASPGPDFSLKHPIARWKEKATNLEAHLDITKHELNDVYVVILEDENFYEQTNKLNFYRKIRPANRKRIHGKDMRAHTVEMFKTFIKFIEKKKIKKSIIIIHCFCGAGRTSSMVMCCKLYFLIEFYLTENPISDEDRKNIVLDIPSLIGFPRRTPALSLTDDGFNQLKTNIKNSPAGKWLTKNYTSTAVFAPPPGKEFLEIEREMSGGITCTFRERLFFKRVSNISKALGHHFEFKYIMTLDEYGCRARLRNENFPHNGENASEYFGKRGEEPTGELEFIRYSGSS